MFLRSRQGIVVYITLLNFTNCFLRSRFFQIVYFETTKSNCHGQLNQREETLDELVRIGQMIRKSYLFQWMEIPFGRPWTQRIQVDGIAFRQ